MAFFEDLSVFFSTDVFGVVATLNGTTSVDGIFDADYFDPLNNVVEGNSPVFRCASADIPTIAHDDTLLVNATTYKVRGVEPDGTGVTLLKLEAQ